MLSLDRLVKALGREVGNMLDTNQDGQACLKIIESL